MFWFDYGCALFVVVTHVARGSTEPPHVVTVNYIKTQQTPVPGVLFCYC
jgi:hypothetical protein